MRLCECGCGRIVPPGRNHNRVIRRFFSRQCKERAYWAKPRKRTWKEPPVGARKPVVDVRCPECERKVDVDIHPWTGRTVQVCGCGVRFIGRWAA